MSEVIKKYLKLKNRILSSKTHFVKNQSLPEIGSCTIVSTIKQLPEIDFWYLFLISKTQPSVQKRKMAKKLKFANKTYFVQCNLNRAEDIFAFLGKIRDVFIPLKEESDLVKSKPSELQKTQLKLRNCTTTDETNQLLLKTNVYIDNINLLLNFSQKTPYDFEYLFHLYNFPINKFFVNK